MVGMGGRVKRKAGLVAATERIAEDAAVLPCALCDRPLGTRVELHHRVPKSRGGTETVPVHPICHRTIHACVSNADLAATLADIETLRAQPEVARFIRWVANKPPDFNAPTRRARRE